MAPVDNSKFCGWCGLDAKSAVGGMKWQQFTPKPFTPTDVDIEITHCGICGSDLHTLRSGWGETPYPCVVGHEIIGRAIAVGDKANVSNPAHKKNPIKVGDRVGVGAQSDSCLGRKPDCEFCADGQENMCPHVTNTFADKYEDGSMSYGGYADYARHPAHFVFKIPDAISSADAAPMLCGGVTVYSPLKQNGCGPGKKVGIVGLGGLGHFGVLFAKALGAEKITVISRSSTKKADALKMGADHFIATDEDKDWAQDPKNANSLDLIVSTVSSPKMPLMGYLSLLRGHGSFIQVGAPEDNLPPFNAFALIAKKCKIGGSMIGSPAEIEEMLELAATQKLKPWVQERKMADANKTVVDMDEGKARYRYVLVNEKNLK